MLDSSHVPSPAKRATAKRASPPRRARAIHSIGRRVILDVANGQRLETFVDLEADASLTVLFSLPRRRHLTILVLVVELLNCGVTVVTLAGESGPLYPIVNPLRLVGRPRHYRKHFRLAKLDGRSI